MSLQLGAQRLTLGEFAEESQSPSVTEHLRASHRKQTLLKSALLYTVLLPHLRPSYKGLQVRGQRLGPAGQQCPGHVGSDPEREAGGWPSAQPGVGAPTGTLGTRCSHPSGLWGLPRYNSVRRGVT